MTKTFYTDHDIEDLARQGVNSLVVDENVVLTDLARDKARRLGIQLLNEQDQRPSSAPRRPYLSEPSPSASDAPGRKPREKPSGADLEKRVFSAVKSRLGDQVDDSLLRTIVQRVIKSIGRG